MRVFKREKRKSKKNFENCSGCVYNIKKLVERKKVENTRIYNNKRRQFN